MKRFIALLAALLIVLGTLPTGMAAAKSDFEIKNGVLIKYTGKGGNVVIPEGVTEIARNAFSQAKLDSLVFPSTLKTICEDAFFWLSGKMKTVTIPASVEHFSSSAFRGTELEAVKVASGNKNYKSMDGVVLSKDGKALVWYPCGKKGSSYTIPGTVETIRQFAFSSAPLQSIVIPASVKTISNEAFYYAKKLKSLTIPATVRTVLFTAFVGCSSLKKLEIKSNDTWVRESNVTYSDMEVPKLTIYAPADHPVKELAKKYKISFKALPAAGEPSDPYGLDAPAVISVKLQKHEITLTRTADNKKPSVKLKYSITPETEFDLNTLSWSWYAANDGLDVDWDFFKPGYITITGLKAGEYSVHCYSPFNGSPLDSCKVTVVDLLAEKLTLNKTTATLNRTSGKKDALQLKAKVTPKDALNRDVKWSSSDKKIATVDKNGKVTPKKAGKVTITCRTKDGSLTASCEITIKNKAVKSITLDQEEATLKKGKTLELKIKKIAPKDAFNQKVKWESSDEKIATVDKNGKVTAKKKGTCIITCTAKDGSNVKAEVKITVK